MGFRKEADEGEMNRVCEGLPLSGGGGAVKHLEVIAATCLEPSPHAHLLYTSTRSMETIALTASGGWVGGCHGCRDG